jgi:hypothetical protein
LNILSDLIRSHKSCTLFNHNRALFLGAVNHYHLLLGCLYLLSPHHLSFDPHVHAPPLWLAHILIALLAPSPSTRRAMKVMVLYFRIRQTYRALTSTTLLLFLIGVLYGQEQVLARVALIEIL